MSGGAPFFKDYFAYLAIQKRVLNNIRTCSLITTEINAIFNVRVVIEKKDILLIKK